MSTSAFYCSLLPSLGVDISHSRTYHGPMMSAWNRMLVSRFTHLVKCPGCRAELQKLHVAVCFELYASAVWVEMTDAGRLFRILGAAEKKERIEMMFVQNGIYKPISLRPLEGM